LHNEQAKTLVQDCIDDKISVSEREAQLNFLHQRLIKSEKDLIIQNLLKLYHY